MLTQLSLFETSTERGAQFSPCRKWRYTLWRVWDETKPSIAFCCLNPSTADEVLDDPTVRRCIRFAERWGYGSYTMLNAYAWRSTDPKGLKLTDDPVGQDNDATLREVAAKVDKVVVAWGVHCDPDRAKRVLRLLGDVDCLGMNANRTPKHPLYLKNDSVLEPYRLSV